VTQIVVRQKKKRERLSDRSTCKRAHLFFESQLGNSFTPTKNKTIPMQNLRPFRRDPFVL